LPAGTHEIVLNKDGYAAARHEFAVPAGGTAQATIQLSPVVSASAPAGQLEITTTPADAEVFIDGKPFGKSPARATLPPGQHEWQVRLGNTIKQGRIQVPAGGTAEEKIEIPM
jgi:hypothetical protein